MPHNVALTVALALAVAAAGWEPLAPETEVPSPPAA